MRKSPESVEEKIDYVRMSSQMPKGKEKTAGNAVMKWVKVETSFIESEPCGL